jgi:mannosyltransferase
VTPVGEARLERAGRATLRADRRLLAWAVSHTPWLVQAVAMLLVAMLGWLFIGARDLSLDELATLDYASRPLPDMLAAFSQRQANMALYTALMAPWVALRDTEAWLRLPSLAFAVATVPLLYRVALRLTTPRAALFTVLLYAVSATVVEQSQNARAYTMTILVAVAATLAFLRAWEAPTRWRVVGYGLLVAAGVYVHFLMGFVAASHGVAALASGDRARTRRLGPAAVLVAVAAAPLAFFVVLGDSGQINWIPPLSLESAGRSAYTVSGGTLFASAFWALGLTIGLALIRRLGNWERLVLLSWLLVPLALVVAISIVKPLVAPRYLVLGLPAALMLIAFGLAKMRRGMGIAFLVIGVLASGTGVIAWYTAPSTRWADATHYVVVASRGNDRILYVVPHAQRAFDYYAHRFGVPARLPAPIDLDSSATSDAPKLWVAVHLLTPEERQVLADRLGPSWVLFRSFGYEGLSLRQYVPRDGP